MRPARVLLEALLLLCLCAQSYAAEPGDIAIPSMAVPDMSMPKPLITRPSMDMPQTQPGPLGEAKSAAGAAINQSGGNSSNQTLAISLQQKATPGDVNGKWSMKFDNAPGHWLELDLWSSAGDAKVMGFGTLIADGRENPVTVAGSLAGRELRLTVRSATPDYSSQDRDEYDLDLHLENNTLSGTYSWQSGGQLSGEGVATAARR